MREFSKIYNCGLVVPTSYFLGVFGIAEIYGFTFNGYFASPRLRLFIPTCTFIAGVLSALASAVPAILSGRAVSEVATPIITTVVVLMVYLISSFRFSGYVVMHGHSSSVGVIGVRSLSPHSVPVPLRKFIVEIGINDSFLPLCESDPSTGFATDIENFIGHFGVIAVDPTAVAKRGLVLLLAVAQRTVAHLASALPKIINVSSLFVFGSTSCAPLAPAPHRGATLLARNLPSRPAFWSWIFERSVRIAVRLDSLFQQVHDLTPMRLRSRAALLFVQAL
jgi:hypothetical protein